VSGLGLALYAFVLEPSWIETTRHALRVPVAAPVRIAQLTDLHTDAVGRRERRLLELIEREQPDLIVITGDSVVNGDLRMLWRRWHDPAFYTGLGRLLGRLRAPLGVYTVRGNWENVRLRPDEAAFYQSVGVRLLVNENVRVRDDLWLVGLDDFAEGVPDPRRAGRGLPSGAYAVALMHSPAYFDRLAGRWPLALAGHTHGGQVRPPLVPPFWLPHGCGRFVAGWYDGLEGPPSRLYVSRGIGTSTLPVRFLCRPELAIFDLMPMG
jgi:predicted MPP superfamily phosphohydrolase